MGKLVLIAGVSRSGKSSLASALSARLQDAIHLDQDQFARPEQEIPLIRDRIDWEAPESIDWTKWKTTISNALKKHRYVIAEGIFALSDQTLVRQASLTILLQLNETEFKARRKRETRWGEEPEWFIQHVWDAHLLHHNPHRIRTDLVLNGFTSEDIQHIIDALKSNKSS